MGLLAGRAVVKPEGQAGREAIDCVSAQGIVAAAMPSFDFC